MYKKEFLTEAIFQLIFQLELMEKNDPEALLIHIGHLLGWIGAEALITLAPVPTIKTFIQKNALHCDQPIRYFSRWAMRNLIPYLTIRILSPLFSLEQNKEFIFTPFNPLVY